MVERRPSVLGIVALSVVYWGALAWWQQDALFGTDSDAPNEAMTMFATSFPYIGFVIWGTSNDLPENIAEIPYLGRMLKPVIWLAVIAFFFGMGVRRFINCWILTSRCSYTWSWSRSCVGLPNVFWF